MDHQRAAWSIMDRPCVDCHGFYDAPCLLKLSVGISRGASTERIHDSSGVTAMGQPRLFVDATAVEADDLCRNPDEDNLTVVEGFVGNFPNRLFRLGAGELNRIGDGDGFGRIVDTYGVRRASPNFWPMSDWFNHRLAEKQRIEAGLLGMDRYSKSCSLAASQNTVM